MGVLCNTTNAYYVTFDSDEIEASSCVGSGMIIIVTIGLLLSSFMYRSAFQNLTHSMSLA